MWDKLINIYEGNEKVKDAKLQTYRVHFEKLLMKEDENCWEILSESRRNGKCNEGTW
jgi:hypothetical protein